VPTSHEKKQLKTKQRFIKIQSVNEAQESNSFHSGNLTKETHTHTHTQRHTNTQTNKHTDTQTHRHTDTQTHRHIQTHARTDTHTDMHAQIHAHARTGTQTHTYTHTRAHRHRHTHRHTHAHTHTHARAHRHTHMHRRTHTLTHAHRGRNAKILNLTTASTNYSLCVTMYYPRRNWYFVLLETRQHSGMDFPFPLYIRLTILNTQGVIISVFGTKHHLI
jgi:hypothetical protein